ncbi:tRNA (adenosine(37)-N6)-dimethylallyltransferase MiaA [soil metagenome]
MWPTLSPSPKCASLNKGKPIIVAGPTGVGKTSFSFELACQFDGEILGADAFQIYRGLETLSAQPTPAQLARVPHHLIGCLDPQEPCDAARYARMAQAVLAGIQSRGKTPIIVGGSGLYVKALTHGLIDTPPVDPELRAELNALTLEELQTRLDATDPTARQYLEFQNARRLIRGLEMVLLTGKSTAELRQTWLSKDSPDFRGLLLFRDREEMRARIEENVATMFQRGVLDEVRALGDIGPTARMAIGYREIQALLNGKMTEPYCRAAMVLATRQYAKRQLTWFRNQFTFSHIDLTGIRDLKESLPTALAVLQET